MKCPKCGFENAPQTRFCANCGSAQPIVQDQRPNKDSYPPISFAQKPPGFRAGAFPREHLITGEIVHWEGKPALIAYLISPLIVTIFGLIIAAIFFNYDFLVALGLFIFILGLIGIIVGYLRWTRTFFALTNRRVLTQYGVFSTKFADCPHDKIQNSVVIKPFFQTLLGYGELLFATAGWRGGINSGAASKMMASGGGVYWNGIQRPAEVKRFVEEVIEVSKDQAKKQDYQMMADIVGQKQTVQDKLSIEERLAKAKQLKDSGTITQEEYEQMRKKILMES